MKTLRRLSRILIDRQMGRMTWDGALLQNQADFEAFMASIPPGSEPVCALDTEADSLHRYKESLCLIQFAVDDRCVLIDPLAIADLSQLATFLDRSVLWMHGADYDMTMLKRQFGTIPSTIYDTQIGARLLGARRFGLADLVLQYFEIELSKSSQKADWGKRPLSEKMIEYALNDVRYLMPMGEMIVEELMKRGRFEWFEESCVAARRKVQERDEGREDVWRIQGSGRLDRRGLAYLRALWNWRDTEAQAWDRPSFMVATNRHLVDWATLLSEGKHLSLPSYFRPDRLRRLKEALAGVEAMKESEFPERLRGVRRRRDSGFDQRLEVLLKRRDDVAAALDLDGSLIAARAVLEAIAADEATPEALMLSWQRRCMELD